MNVSTFLRHVSLRGSSTLILHFPRQSCHLIHGKVATPISEFATLDNHGYIFLYFTRKEGDDNARQEAYTANKEIRYLRATFNYGKKKKLINCNPVDSIDFLPIDKKLKYIPPLQDIEKVIRIADEDTRDYLITICDTMARVGEVNQLCWSDIDLQGNHVILYTRKKKGGHRTPRKVPMTKRLSDILNRRFNARDTDHPWIFWHNYYSRREQKKIAGPFGYRKRTLKSLCKKAGVPYFSFHALRHAGATVMDNHNVPIGSIQRILGHENRTTTEIYLHSLGTSEIEAMITLEKARENSHTNSHTKRKALNP